MSDTLLDTVEGFIERHGLLEGPGQAVLVGASGGVDSMTCLSVLRRLGYDVHALHANYGLREGADADEALVREWCADQVPPVPLRAVSLDAGTRATARDESLQEAARRLRYDALAEGAREVGATVVAVGHHRDDQAETLLLNLVRGAGPEGLAGMRPSRPLESESSVSLVRPLLDVSRSDIETYAEAIDLPWRRDPTNRSHEYDRGVVRTEILPLLSSHFEGVRGTLARSAELMGEYVDQAFHPALEERMDRMYETRDEGGWLDLALLRAEPSVLRRRVLLEALDRTLPAAPQSYALADELEALVDAQVGRHVEVSGGEVWREREGIQFLPDRTLLDTVSSTPVSWNDLTDLPQGTIEVSLMSDRPERMDAGSPLVEYADADRLGEELVVRSWQDGDRFQPLGMEGTKRVSRYLTDAQVPSHRRSATCVLCTSSHIAWVVGHRLDHRVRVRPDTDRVARLRFRPHEKLSDAFQSS